MSLQTTPDEHEQNFTPSKQSDATPQPSNKRRRVALACSNCRHRKSRCDGRRPRCSLCTELGCECQYEQAGTATTLTVGKSYISQLEARLQQLESSVKRLEQVPAKIASPSQHTFLPETEASNEGSDISLEHSNYIYHNSSDIGEFDTAEDAIDGMGAMKFTDEEDCGYFGPSSNIAFLRHISFAMARGYAPVEAIPSSSQRFPGKMSVSRPHHAREKANHSNLNLKNTSVNIYALPPEDRTWSMIREYFQKTGQLLPFIHEESFCDTYVQMKRTHFTMARRTWLGLLNIIFAMATTLSVEGKESAEERIEESKVYYQRANALCDKESKRNISLELVQYLLILGQYLQGTQKSVQAWTVHGLAITTALQLGLHSPRTNAEFSALDAEMRKRVWYGCILLDRTLSMTFGRPAMIPDKYVKLELPITSIRIVGQTPQSDSTSQMDAMCFIATIKLYSIMYDIIDTCYGQNLGLEDVKEDSEIFSSVLAGERKLETLRCQIEPELCLCIYKAPLQPQSLETMEKQNLIVQRFNIVLSLRYHNVRILLHRPILEKILGSYTGYESSGGVERSILQQIGIRNIETCVESAKIIISIVHTVVQSSGWRRDLLGAWNYSLFYTFNAGLVLFAALLVTPQSVKEDPTTPSTPWGFIERIPQFLNKSIEALQHLDRGNRVVFRCVEYLSQLCSTLVKSTDFSTNESANFGDIHNANLPVSALAQAHASVGSQPLAFRDLSIDMDLNEFMLDTDFTSFFN